MVVTEYKVGDLIVDDRDKTVGLIYARGGTGVPGW